MATGLFDERAGRRREDAGEDGFMLLFALVMVFLVLLTLSVAAPRIAKSIQRDREQESAQRAQQYVRALRIFYLKFKRYPTSMEQLEKTNNQRFLRQKYVDPLTGKDDWRLIHIGENQTKVKGFFGEDLPGLPTGLGSAAGLSSSTGGGSTFGSSGTNSPGGSSFGGANAGGSAFGGATGAGQAGAGGFGQSGTGAGGLGQNGSNTGAGTTGSTSGMNGIASQDATSFTGSGGGPIIGIGSAKSGEAMLVVNEQTTYEAWEFLYDPRIEQLYSKTTLLGGIASGAGTSGFGTNGSGTGTNNGFGNPGSLGFGSGSTGGTGTGTPTGPTGPAPTGTMPPQ